MTSTNPDLNDVPALDRKFRLQFEQAQDTWVLLYPEGMVKLNTSAAEILKRCDGKNNVQMIITELQQAFEVDDLTDEVNSFLGIATEQQWIQIKKAAPTEAN